MADEELECADVRLLPIGGDRWMVVERDDYIERVETALLSWRREARRWIESDYPAKYLEDMDKRMAEHQPVVDALLEQYEWVLNG